MGENYKLPITSSLQADELAQPNNVLPIAEVRTPINSPNELSEDFTRGWQDRLMLGAAAVSLAFQQSPGNEVARAYVGLATLQYTGKPLLAGLAFGAATFAIEGVTGSAAAYSMRRYSDKFHNTKETIFTKFKQVKPLNEKGSRSLATDSVLALSVGSAAVAARRHYYDRERTALEDNLTVVKAAGGIALVSAGVAYGGAELLNRSQGTWAENYVSTGLELLSDWKTYLAAITVFGGIALAKKMRKKEDYKSLDRNIDRELGEIEDIDYDQKGYLSLRIDNHESELARRALEFEQAIWDDKNYGSLDEYNDKYLKNTRLYASFRDGKCIGSVRVFSGENNAPIAPFIADMDYGNEDERRLIQNGYQKAEIEELATSAAENTVSSRNVIRSLWRLAYRDSVARGVTHWGIIMEPKRARILNRMNGFTFRQKGEEIDYQGGMCAPHLMDLTEVVENMRKEKPKLLHWFISEELRRSF